MINKDVYIYNAKRDKNRIIPIVNNKLFKDLKNHCQSKNIEEKVFDVSYAQINYLIKRIKKELNSNEKIEPRTFRISFAKYCVELGMNLTDIQNAMGHDDISITEIYAKSDYKSLKGFCEKVRKGEINNNSELIEAKKIIKELQKTISELNKIIKDLRNEKN